MVAFLKKSSNMEEKIPYEEYPEDQPVEIPHQHQKRVNGFLLLSYILIVLWSIYYIIAYYK